MHAHLRRQLARLADWFAEGGGTATLHMSDASRIDVVGFECETIPPGFSVADVIERSAGHLVTVRLAEDTAIDVLDVPLLRIVGIQSDRVVGSRQRGDPEDVHDLDDEEGLRRFVGDGLVTSPTGFARRVAAADGLGRVQGAGPEIVMAAEASRLADPRQGDPRRGRHVPDLVAALCETLPKAAKNPDAWFANLRKDLLGPLGRDLRDLHDVGGVEVSLGVAIRCVGRVSDALSR